MSTHAEDEIVQVPSMAKELFTIEGSDKWRSTPDDLEEREKCSISRLKNPAQRPLPFPTPHPQLRTSNKSSSSPKPSSSSSGELEMVKLRSRVQIESRSQ